MRRFGEGDFRNPPSYFGAVKFDWQYAYPSHGLVGRCGLVALDLSPATFPANGHSVPVARAVGGAPRRCYMQPIFGSLLGGEHHVIGWQIDVCLRFECTLLPPSQSQSNRSRAWVLPYHGPSGLFRQVVLKHH